MSSEIVNKLETLCRNWEEYKQVNDRRMYEIEKRGSCDPITANYLANLDNQLDMQKSNASRPLSEKGGISINNKASLVHKQQFVEYLKKGNESGLLEIEKKALSSGNNSEGGYLVTRSVTDFIANRLNTSSPMRSLASISVVAGDTLELVEDFDEANSGWTLETAARDETNSPQISKKIIEVHEIYAQPKATQKLLDDAFIDIESWLASKLADSFLSKENAAFINGDGIGKPKGILTYANGTGSEQIEQITCDSSGFSADAIIKLFYSLHEQYAVNGKFLMNRSVLQAIRMLKNQSTGQYIWQPSLNESGHDTILGCEIVLAADMPAITASGPVVAFADFKAAYHIVDRQSVRILRDPFTDKPFVKFYATKRVGGDVVNAKAIKLLSIAA